MRYISATIFTLYFRIFTLYFRNDTPYFRNDLYTIFPQRYTTFQQRCTRYISATIYTLYFRNDIYSIILQPYIRYISATIYTLYFCNDIYPIFLQRCIRYISATIYSLHFCNTQVTSRYTTTQRTNCNKRYIHTWRKAARRLTCLQARIFTRIHTEWLISRRDAHAVSAFEELDQGQPAHRPQEANLARNKGLGV